MITATFCLYFYPLSRHDILGPYLYHFIYYIPIFTTYQCVLFARILIFHLLSFFLNGCYTYVAA